MNCDSYTKLNRLVLQYIDLHHLEAFCAASSTLYEVQDSIFLHVDLIQMEIGRKISRIPTAFYNTPYTF